MPGKNYAGGCSTCCGCSNWVLTVNYCGVGAAQFPLAGATVTIGSNTQTTDGSGKATFTSAQKGASGTITASGYCNKSFTVPADCSNLTVSMDALTGPVTFVGRVCCNSFNANGSYPVSVSVTQTSGGTYSGSCTDSGGGCTLTLPFPCTGTYSFSVTWSSTGMTSQTTTLTLFPGGCPQLIIGPALTNNGTTNFCAPGSNCTSAFPASLSVTIAPGGACGGACAATYTVPLTSSAAGSAIYSGTFTCAEMCNGINGTISITISVGGCPTASFPGVVVSISNVPPPGPFGCNGCGPYGEQGGTFTGTGACPISFSVELNDPANTLVTVTQ